MRDVCDGQYVKQHKFLSAHPAALQFMVYHDDIEVANPLGSKAGVHKLGKCVVSSTLSVRFTGSVMACVAV